jgi:hypothetical protein
MEHLPAADRLKQDIDKIIANALRSDVIPKTSPVDKYITIHFRLFQKKKPVSGAKITWSHEKGKPLETFGPGHTDENGRGMVCFPEEVLRDLNSLQLKVTMGKKTITFQGFRLETSKDITLSGPESTQLEIISSPELLSVALPKGKRRKRFVVAISGKSDQLKATVPLFKKRSCFRLKKVFVDGKLDKKSSVFYKNIGVSKINRSLPRILKGIEVLFDFSNNSYVTKMAADQLKGRRKTKTIIINDLDRFPDIEHALLSYFEK